MSQAAPFKKLRAVLQELGIRTIEDRERDGIYGYPVVLPLPDGQQIFLDLPEPTILNNLDPEQVGVAVLDMIGFTRRTWGLAATIDYFEAQTCIFDTDLSSLVEAALKGVPGALYLDGHRYYVSSIEVAEDKRDVVIVVTNAYDEMYAKRLASKSQRSAEALKRLGKTLTMYQNLQPLSVAVVHEIASVAELAAVLLWTRVSETEPLQLSGSVGANRQGTSALAELETEGSISCAAEMVATRCKAYKLKNVNESIMTASLEAKFCYLKPGGLVILPLTIGDRLLGILELIGREGDRFFPDNNDLFETIAEHLALALNSAMLFENMERQATNDALTGIPNHRTMQEFLHSRVAEAERMGQELGVIMIDVDHFRSFNEEEGHDAGDDVLKKVVEALKSEIRPYDMLARYGGEEFTIIMPGASAEEVLALAERVRSRVERKVYTTRTGSKRHITVSLGCSVYPSNATDPQRLLKTADMALFRAKRAGRNRAFLYDSAYIEELAERSLDLMRVLDWVDQEDLTASKSLSEQLHPYVQHVADSLGLSELQEHILDALIRLMPTYRRYVEQDREDILSKMESASELRVLMPNLHAVFERFDGEGPKKMRGALIPLLARVLSVLLAIAEEGETAFSSDSGRFDPEIVTLVRDFRAAA